MWRPLLCTAVLLALPLAAAQPLGELGASSLTANEAALEGPLTALASRDRSDGPGPVFGSMELEASEIRVEIDHEHRNHSVAGINAMPSETSTEVRFLHDARLEGHRAGQRAYVFLQAEQAHAAIEGGLTVRQQEEAAAQHVWVVSERPSMEPEGENLAVRLDGPGVVQVTGSFVLAVWDWDLQYEDASGEGLLRSGEERRSTAGAVTDRHLRQTYLFVRDGSARFTVERPQDLTAFTQTAVVDSSARMTFQDAHGLLDGHDVTGGDVEVIGETTAAIAAAGGRLAVRLDGDPDAFVLDGRSIPHTASTSDLPWWLLATLSSLLAAYAVLRLGGRALLRRAERAMDAQDHRRALRLAGWVKRGRLRSDAAVIMAIAALHLGRNAQAEAAIRRIDTRQREPAAVREYLLAHMADRRGDLDGAEDHMAKSILLDANVERDVPMQRPVRRDADAALAYA